MTSNVSKRLDKLHKDISDLGAKARSFHFIVGDSTESAEAKLERLKAEGTIQAGDECQMIEVPWAISQLKGSAHIPEGSTHDPLADPGLPQPPMPVSKANEEREREERWRQHEKKIEADGTRYDDNKSKYKDGIY